MFWRVSVRVRRQLGRRVRTLVHQAFEQLPSSAIGQHTEELVERLPTSGAHVRTSATASRQSTINIRRRSHAVDGRGGSGGGTGRPAGVRLDDRQAAAVAAVAALTRSHGGDHQLDHRRLARPVGRPPREANAVAWHHRVDRDSAFDARLRRPPCPRGPVRRSTSAASVSHSAHRSPSATSCHSSSDVTSSSRSRVMTIGFVGGRGLRHAPTIPQLAGCTSRDCRYSMCN